MLLRALLPVRCPGCGALSPAGDGPCAACAAGLRPAPAGPRPAGLDACWSLFAYQDVGKAVVTSLKYRRDRAALAWLAAGMAALAAPPAGVVVTWAPTTAARRRQRGFDQAELLARAVARCWRAPCRPLLARKAGLPQTGRSLADRRQGPILLARAGSRAAAAGPAGGRGRRRRHHRVDAGGRGPGARPPRRVLDRGADRGPHAACRRVAPLRVGGATAGGRICSSSRPDRPMTTGDAGLTPAGRTGPRCRPSPASPRVEPPAPPRPAGGAPGPPGHRSRGAHRRRAGPAHRAGPGGQRPPGRRRVALGRRGGRDGPPPRRLRPPPLTPPARRGTGPRAPAAHAA